MKIAYISKYDPANLRAWSGTAHYVFAALAQAGCQVTSAGPLQERYTWLTKAKKAGYQLLGQNYLRDREPAVARAYAAQAERLLPALQPEVILGPGTLPVAYLRAAPPIVFWTDASFAGLLNFYPDFSNLCAETIRQGNQIEQAALDNCRLAIYTSDWAAQTALENYCVAPEKVKVVPFGANLERGLTQAELQAGLDQKDFNPCRLLFVGVDWRRKGGDLALAVAEQLNQGGRPAELHLVGAAPPGPIPAYVRAHGFLSKHDPAGRARLAQLYRQAHFVILPTRADCVPVVIAEANAYGLPALATRVGGIPSVLKDGVNGQTFDLQAGPQAYCDYIERLLAAPEAYRRLASAAWEEYHRRLNWETAGRAVAQLLRELI